MTKRDQIETGTIKTVLDYEGSLKQDFSSSGDDPNFMSSNRQQYSESLETIMDLQLRPSNDIIVFSHRSSN